MKHLLFALLLVSAFKTNAQISFMYSDKNSNTYTIKETELKYDPVQKEESSSGMYSGGEPKIKIITPYELNKISVLFEEALSDSLSHEKGRKMGSGLFIRYKKTKLDKKIIVKFDSEMQKKIEDLLRGLL